MLSSAIDATLFRGRIVYQGAQELNTGEVEVKYYHCYDYTSSLPKGEARSPRYGMAICRSNGKPGWGTEILCMGWLLVCGLVCWRQQGLLLHNLLLPADLPEPHQDLRQQVHTLLFSLHSSALSIRACQRAKC